MSFCYAFPPRGGCAILESCGTYKVFECHVITCLYQMTCRNSSVSFWYVLTPLLIIVAAVKVALCHL